MKISKLYANDDRLFEPIYFEHGLNVVLAEIRLPENRNKDTHNLGKTTLGRLLDFCLLSTRNNRFFLFKHINEFENFIFFLEICLADGSYVTVRRSVKNASKISFKKHEEHRQDFNDLPDGGWDHFEIAFERSRELLDSLLDWRVLKPWTFRNVLGYQLRSQDDFRDVFQLRKFQGSHSSWKPFIAHVLGFNADITGRHYDKEKQLSESEDTEKTIRAELGGSVEDLSKIEGILLLKTEEAEKKQKLLDSFDFRSQDKEQTKQLVNEIDSRISLLNSERYSLRYSKKKIVDSLNDDQILFDPEEAKQLFYEAGILFQGQIKKDFQQLIEFNNAISEERRAYLQEEMAEIDKKLKTVNSELNNLGKERSTKLSFLSDTDVFNKYKELSDMMVVLRSDINSLERQKGLLNRLQELRTDIRSLKDELAGLQSEIEEDVETQNGDRSSLFSSIRLFFNEIIEHVIGKKALLSVSSNSQGHLEFKAEILDESGNATSADLGHTYRKLLCVAFDLAVLRARYDHGFPRFVYHDGVFESLDDRKKENLLEVMREYSEIGIQQIITLIDTDMPSRTEGAGAVFESEEIVLTLHDEGICGRLFKMNTW